MTKTSDLADTRPDRPRARPGRSVSRPAPGRYRLMLVDCPWRYDARGSRLAPSYAGKGRSTAHYEPMADEALAEYLAGAAGELAADAIVLFWVTNSVLLEGRHLPLLRALGVKPAQVIPWIKTTASGSIKIGGGSYTRVCSEHLVLAQRASAGLELRDMDDVDALTLSGEVPAPAAGEYSLVLARRGRAAALIRHRGIAGALVGPPAERRHSSKPEVQYELAEALVEGPYLELFARRARPGWDARGDQIAPSSLESAPADVQTAPAGA